MRKIEFSANEFYHIYSRGTEKRKIFLNDHDRNRFLALLYVCNSTKVIHLSDYPKAALSDLLDLERGDQLVDIGAYCLMPNHFHFLVRGKDDHGISIFMQKLLTAYTMYFNKKYDRNGTLFQGRFRISHADKDNYLKYLFAYIHLNPVKLIDKDWKEQGISDLKKAKDFLRQYDYSSYLDYFKKEPRLASKVLNKSAFPSYFENHKDFVSEIKEWLGFNPLSRPDLDSGLTG